MSTKAAAGAAVPGFWSISSVVGDRTAVIDRDGTLTTYADLAARVHRLSHALRHLGLQPDDRVAVVLPNRAAFLELSMATSQIGVVQIPVNSHLTAPETRYILDDSRPALVVADDSTINRVRDAAGSAGRVASMDRDAELSLPELAAGEPSDEPEGRIGGPTMVYTSGTSGQPKGVWRSTPHAPPEESVVPGLTYLLRRFGIDPTEEIGNGVHLALCPMYHGAPGGYARLALHLGHTVVIPERFDAATALELIERHDVTWTMVVPTMFKRLLDLPEDVRRSAVVSSLRWVFHAGAPCPPAVKRRMLDWWGPIVHEFYASSEAGGTCISAQDWLAHAPSVGRAWPGADVRILDEHGADLPAGEVGQIFFLDTRPFEYHNDPQKSGAARTPDGSYVTVGDLGYLDDEGYLYLASRRSDLILSGGVNVYPAEIEAVLLESPLVADAAVFGDDDPDRGQVPVAVIEPKELDTDEVTLIDALSALCQQRLASFKRPRRYVVTDDIGRTAAGKTQRHALQRQFGSSAAMATSDSRP